MDISNKLKLCIIVKAKLIANISTAELFSNGSTGKIEYFQVPRGRDHLLGIICVKFDDIDTNNYLKNSLLRDELKECIPVAALTETFPYSHKNKTVTVQPKQFSLKLGHVFTIHDFQSSTVKFMKWGFNCTSKTDKPNDVPINPGAIYKVLSLSKLALSNFRSQKYHIKHFIKDPVFQRNCDEMIEQKIEQDKQLF